MSVNNEFKIKFGGQLHQVDANTFIYSLVNISTVIQEINQELRSDKKIEIKIKATEEGSFITTLILEHGAGLAKLFTTENINLTASIIAIFAGVFTIKEFLKNKKPKNEKEEGDKITIENEKGNVLIIDNRTYGIYNRNQIINDAISNNFSTLESDPSIDDFEIISENKSLFKAERENFDQLATKSEVADKQRKEKIVSANLILHKVVFEDKYKWEFYYSGNKISANIVDNEFYKKIDKGEPFAKGDALKVELQINQIFDEGVGIYINHSYQINKVIEHIPRSQQLKIENFS